MNVKEERMKKRVCDKKRKWNSSRQLKQRKTSLNVCEIERERERKGG